MNNRKNPVKSYKKPQTQINNGDDQDNYSSNKPRNTRHIVSKDGVKNTEGPSNVKSTNKKLDKDHHGVIYTEEKNSKDLEQNFISEQDAETNFVEEQVEIFNEQPSDEWSNNILDVIRKCISNLSVRSIPGEVNFRDKEKFKISNFLVHFIVGNGLGCSTLIVTGQPGAGKTQLINTYLDKIERQQMKYFVEDVANLKLAESEANNKPTKTEDTELSEIKIGKSSVEKTSYIIDKSGYKIYILRINAMRYRVCIQFLIDAVYWVFSQSGKSFKRDIIKNAVYLLEMLKTNLSNQLENKVIIIQIDELDALVTHDRKNFDVIIDLQNINAPGFIKIGISNTVDLFSTYKGTKNYLNFKQLTFRPYNETDLLGILKERINEPIKHKLTLDKFVDQNVTRIICKKESKNASGDIRSMLEVSKEIFETKWRKIKAMILQESKQSCDENKENMILEKIEIGKKQENSSKQIEEFPGLNVNELENKYKISMTDAIEVLNSKYEDKVKHIVSCLNLNLQAALQALYFSLKENEEGCDYKKFCQKYQDTVSTVGIESGQSNIKDMLTILENYNFLKMEKKKNNKVNSENFMIKSNLKRYELQEYLMEIEAFASFIDN